MRHINISSSTANRLHTRHHPGVCVLRSMHSVLPVAADTYAAALLFMERDMAARLVLLRRCTERSLSCLLP
jgi:hypothetical protein